MSFLRSLCLLVAAPGLLLAPFALGGCAEDSGAVAPVAQDATGGEVGDLTEDGSADANDWQHQASSNLSCTEAVDATVSQKSRRHYYSFGGLKGQTASFTFDGTWTGTWGARVYVRDAAGNVVGTATNPKGNAVSLSVTFPADGKYFVYVSPSSYKAIKKTYQYDLIASCEAPQKPICATVRVTQNVSSPTLYAHEFTTENAAEAWFETFASGEKTFAAGECAARACNKLYKPVCGVIKSGEAQTYGNACAAESSIIADAGADVTGASKGFYTDGACVVAPKCDYASPTRHYVVQKLEQCKLVKFRCAPGEQGFSDECGCGCEKL